MARIAHSTKHVHKFPAHLCDVCGKPFYLNAKACRSCVLRQHWRDGVYALSPARKHWSWRVEEDQVIRDLAGHVTAAEIAMKLPGRTRVAVQLRAAKLGVYLSNSAWTQSKIQRLFALGERTVRRDWLEAGLIEGVQYTGHRKGDQQLVGWRVTDEALARFIRECPWAFRADRMVPASHPMAQLARAIQRRDPWLRLREVGEYLGLDHSTVAKWCRKGVIPFKRRAEGDQRGPTSVVRASDLPAIREAIESHPGYRAKKGLKAA